MFDRGALPHTPRFIALIFQGGDVNRTKEEAMLRIAPLQTHQDARGAPQRCPILPCGKALLVYH